VENRPIVRVRILATLGVLVLVVLAGAVLGWFGGRGRAPQIPISSIGHSASAQPVREQPVSVPPTPISRSNRVELSTPAVSNTAPESVAISTNLISDWEDKLDEILQADVKEDEKARKMLQIFPHLPPDGQTEVAQHLSNLVSDQDYAPLGKLLADDKLPEPVLDVLMADVLNRPNSLKLPELLEVARDPQHPKASEARDLLELFLEENYGNNWTQWQAKMDQWLKANPD